MQILDINLWKVSIQGSFPPKLETWRGSNRYLTHIRLQVKGCAAERYCSQRAREFPRSGQLLCMTYSCGATGVKIAQFYDFGQFSQYKTPKTYLPVTSLQPRGYIAKWLRFFHVVVESRKGCHQAAQFSCNFW